MLLEILERRPTLGTSSESGLKRVPLDGPPTYGKHQLKMFPNGA